MQNNLTKYCGEDSTIKSVTIDYDFYIKLLAHHDSFCVFVGRAVENPKNIIYHYKQESTND